mmetsp:Transcript_45041/g.124819  ORF Transcript_45041/g.124819 Transcript_45041/m.124819 type:complete len:228 (-) Transcript_45041:100-783(-)
MSLPVHGPARLKSCGEAHATSTSAASTPASVPNWSARKQKPRPSTGKTAPVGNDSVTTAVERRVVTMAAALTNGSLRIATDACCAHASARATVLPLRAMYRDPLASCREAEAIMQPTSAAMIAHAAAARVGPAQGIAAATSKGANHHGNRATSSEARRRVPPTTRSAESMLRFTRPKRFTARARMTHAKTSRGTRAQRIAATWRTSAHAAAAAAMNVTAAKATGIAA